MDNTVGTVAESASAIGYACTFASATHQRAEEVITSALARGGKLRAMHGNACRTPCLVSQGIHPHEHASVCGIGGFPDLNGQRHAPMSARGATMVTLSVMNQSQEHAVRPRRFDTDNQC